MSAPSSVRVAVNSRQRERGAPDAVARATVPATSAQINQNLVALVRALAIAAAREQFALSQAHGENAPARDIPNE